jgi:glycosyltransferase involved in cell wall biosynthesis
MENNSQGKVSIVIPVFNEESVIQAAVEKLVADLDGDGIKFQLVLAENGSSDATLRIAQSLASRDARISAIHLDTPNYGNAMRRGFLAASGECAANFSIDFIDLQFLRTGLDRMSNFDLVLGSKYLDTQYDQRPLPRRLCGRLLSQFVRTLFCLPVSDTHGIMVFRRTRLVSVLENCKFGNEVFDTELIVRAHRAGAAICEVPIKVEENRPSRLGSFLRARRMLGQFARMWMVLRQEEVI